jgi:hypothetical protein
LRNERWDLAGRAFLLKWLVTLTYGPWIVMGTIAWAMNVEELAAVFVCGGLVLVVVSLVYATMYLSLLARIRADLKEEAGLATREGADIAEV